MAAKRPINKSSHADLGIIIHDYNGTGQWRRDAIERRYALYAATFGVGPPAEVSPRESFHGGARWTYPVMTEVIEAIKRDDAAAIEIGVEFIEEDTLFPFGKILKSNTARALRRATLTDTQIERIRRRVIGMLISGQTPRELEDYTKLLRKYGAGSLWNLVDDRIDRNNPHVMKHYNYIIGHVL